MGPLRSFFDDYRTAFARYDRDALSALFTYPLHVVSATEDAVAISVSDRDEWRGVLDRLLDAYRSLGVVDALPLELDVSELTPQVGGARVHWELRRKDGSAVYRFTAIYTVVQVDGARRVAAIAHDELPKLRPRSATRGISGARQHADSAT